MAKRKYSQQLLEAIHRREYLLRENGMDILIKPIPETDEPGVLDPRLYKSMAPLLKGFYHLLLRLLTQLGGKRKRSLKKSARRMRAMMDVVKSISIVKDVQVRETVLQKSGTDIPIRIYSPFVGDGTPKPVFYYIHGGGFVAGNMNVVDEICRMVVQYTGYRAVQLQYRLAPEHPYPAAFEDCCAVLEWIAENAESFGGNPRQICISGDSAGGNLAAACALKDRDDGHHRVALQALLYPCVDLTHFGENIDATRKLVAVSDSQKQVIHRLFGLMEGLKSGPSMAEYLGVEDPSLPYVSPCLAPLHSLPPTLLLGGEYDFLRAENDLYARQLHQAGTAVQQVRYQGIYHGFADQVGVTPQAEDALIEIGDFMKAHFEPA